MTRHLLAEDTEQDIRTMKSLRNLVLGFVGFTLVLALGVAFFAP